MSAAVGTGTAAPAAIDCLEAQTLRRVGGRILPLAAAMLLCAYLDKINVGFAALQMNADLRLSGAAFGLGAGAFALGYALFALPSTMMLHRFGARRWLSAIMVAWGSCSAATAFVTNVESLVLVRFALGAAEAGFSPGIVLYFSGWFPEAYRGRAMGWFLFVHPLALVVCGPLSGYLLTLDGMQGLAGWQWLFLIEAAPSLVVALIALRFLTDGPEQAAWLPADEKAWLRARLAQERLAIAAGGGRESVGHALRDRRVWRLGFVNLAVGTAGIGSLFFTPLIIRSMGFSDVGTGLMVSLPGLLGGLSLPLWGWWTDRARSREWVVASACVMLAVGLALEAVMLPSAWALLPLCLGMIGFNGMIVAFWTLPSSFLTGAGAAAGIAAINVAGNLGTFSGPYLLGWMSDATHGYGTGLGALAVIALVAAATMLGGASSRPDARGRR